MPIVRLMLVVVGTAAHLGLGVAGWGGLAFFSHPARLVLSIVLVVMAIAAAFAC